MALKSFDMRSHNPDNSILPSSCLVKSPRVSNPLNEMGSLDPRSPTASEQLCNSLSSSQAPLENNHQIIHRRSQVQAHNAAPEEEQLREHMLRTWIQQEMHKLESSLLKEFQTAKEDLLADPTFTSTLEWRIVAHMEEVLEHNFTKHSKLLQNSWGAEFVDGGCQIKTEAAQRQDDPGASGQIEPLASPAPSAPRMPPKSHAVFRRLDKSHDGGLSKEEWLAAIKAEQAGLSGSGRRILGKNRADLETAQEVFDRLDANHDGLVNQEEWDAGIEAEEALAKKEGGSVKTLFARHRKKGPHLGHQIEADDALQDIVHSLAFQVSVILVIVLQSVCLGWEANERLQLEIERLEGTTLNTDIPSHFAIISIVFSCFFVLEILLRLVAWRSKFFSLTDQEFFMWNVFDLLMVGSIVLENMNIDIHVLRSVRLLRVARVLRILRVVPKLRKMIYALMHSMQSLFWLIIMLSVTLYIFALTFMQGALQYLEEKTPKEYQDRKASDFSEMRGTFIILERFGNLGLAMRSLFAAITGGDPWDWLLQPIMKTSWVFSLVAFFFVVFFVFAVMNIVTGVFVDEAMKISQIDKDIMIQDIQAEDLLLRHDMEQLVKTLDEDGDGTIEVDELRRMLENGEVQRWLAGCDIDLSLENLQQILAMLDHNNTGRVNPDDFFSILSRIKGHARSVDLCLLHHAVELQAVEMRNLRAVLQSWGQR